MRLKSIGGGGVMGVDQWIHSVSDGKGKKKRERQLLIVTIRSSFTTNYY